MTAPRESKQWHVGAQNDQIYVIEGRAPSKDNDYPSAAVPAVEEHDDDYEGHQDRDCFTCGGDGYVMGSDLDDPLWYDYDEVYKCPNCRGSGNAKDQTYW